MVDDARFALRPRRVAVHAGTGGPHGRAAGCDVLPVCNDRTSALRLLDGLRASPDPVSRLRLVRLHGRDAEPSPLDRNPRWQEAVAAARGLIERPALELEGERPA